MCSSVLLSENSPQNITEFFFRQMNKRTNYSLCVHLFFCLKTHHKVSQSFFRQMNKRTNYSLCVHLFFCLKTDRAQPINLCVRLCDKLNRL